MPNRALGINASYLHVSEVEIFLSHKITDKTRLAYDSFPFQFHFWGDSTPCSGALVRCRLKQAVLPVRTAAHCSALQRWAPLSSGLVGVPDLLRGDALRGVAVCLLC